MQNKNMPVTCQNNICEMFFSFCSFQQFLDGLGNRGYLKDGSRAKKISCFICLKSKYIIQMIMVLFFSLSLFKRLYKLLFACDMI